MKNPNHISECLKSIFWVKILKFFEADSGSEMKKIRIRDVYPGSARLIARMSDVGDVGRMGLKIKMPVKILHKFKWLRPRDC